MALSEFEIRRCEKLMNEYIERHRPPVHIRAELDIGYRISGQSVEIFEIRPAWRGKPGDTMEQAVAKATFVKTERIWKIYWQRADLKWHRYEPDAEVPDMETFIRVVERDEHCCFYG